MEVDTCIAALIQYGLDCGLIEPCDRTYLINQLLQTLKLDSYHPAEPEKLPLEEILRQLLDDAVRRGVCDSDSTSRDLLDTALMGVRNKHEADENCAATAWELTAEEIAVPVAILRGNSEKMLIFIAGSDSPQPAIYLTQHYEQNHPCCSRRACRCLRTQNT